MPVNLDTLRAQPLSLIGPATQTLASGGSIGAWRQAMEVAIRRSQTAAYIAATAERLGTTPALVKGLSRAERKELDARIDAQLKYLDGFVADLRAGKLTMAQAQARAAMYSGATRGTFYATRYQNLPFYPTEGSECMTNCKCSWEQKDGEYYWRMAASEHCPTCQTRAGGNPYSVDVTTTKAQTDQEKAMFAAMGGGGGSGGGGKGGGGKSTLWPKGPNGKRTPQAAAAATRQTNGSGKPSAQATVDSKDRSLRRAGLLSDKDMQQDERQSLQWYQGVGHDRINAELRGSEPVRDQYTLGTTTANLDRMMDRSKLKHGVTVHRGMLPETLHAETELARMQPGAIIRDPGYVSTTASTAVAKRFGGDAVSISIRAPAGTPALYMPIAAPLRGTSHGAHNEYELLLGRDLSYRVISRREENGKTTIEVEVVP